MSGKISRKRACWTILPVWFFFSTSVFYAVFLTIFIYDGQVLRIPRTLLFAMLCGLVNLALPAYFISSYFKKN